MKHQPLIKDNCYVLHQGYYNDILRLKYDDVILYPERGLTMVELRCGVKYENSVITEDPSIIAMYDRKNVWRWVKDEDYPEGEWVNPDYQTYGTSHEILMDDLLYIRSSIPLRIMDSKSVEVLKEKLRKLYE